MYWNIPPSFMLTVVKPVSPPPANAGRRPGGTGSYSPAVRAEEEDCSRLGRIGCYVRALLLSDAVNANLL
jgi:hypothetical protein